jgi:hypothetical protein
MIEMATRRNREHVDGPPTSATSCDWGCISTEASCDTIQVLLAGAPTEPQAELQIRTCLGAWLATHPGVEAEIIA